MKTETGEQMTENQICLRYDEIAEIEAQLSVGDYLICDEQRQKVTDIYYLSTHCCITIILADGGKISWGRLKEMVLDTNKGVIVRCSHPEVDDCIACSLSNYGRDCANNKNK